jgi:glutamate dehydrogenase
VLLAYSKIVLSDELAESPIVDDEYVGRTLVEYFPPRLRARYPDFMKRHALRHEIIATVLANTMINRTGSVFVHRMQEETGAVPEEVTRAYILVRDVFELEPLWLEIDALDNRVPAQLQYEMLQEVGRLVVRATLWFLRRRREKLPIGQVLDIFRPGVAALRASMPVMLSPPDRAAWDAGVERLTKQGVPRPLAESIANLDAIYGVLDVTEVSTEQKKSAEVVSTLYFALGGELELRWISERISLLPTDTSWQALARNALRDDLAAQHRAITSTVAKLVPQETDPGRMMLQWKERYGPAIARLKTMIEDLRRTGGTLDLAVLSVLLRELRTLA